MSAWERMERAIEGLHFEPFAGGTGEDELEAALRELKATTKAQLLGLDAELKRVEAEVEAILEAMGE